jgi:hypothetical protein
VSVVLTKTQKVIITVAAAVVALVALVGFWTLIVPGLMWGSLMGEVRDSAIEGNVPEPGDFDLFLKRDLESYFGELMGTNVAVDYELLRDGPSQAGSAYPKFYAWVSIFDGSTLLEEGVVRVGAVDKVSFYVTHYLTADDIRQSPDSIREIFAEDVCRKIEERIK